MHGNYSQSGELPGEYYSLFPSVENRSFAAAIISAKVMSFLSETTSAIIGVTARPRLRSRTISAARIRTSGFALSSFISCCNVSRALGSMDTSLSFADTGSAGRPPGLALLPATKRPVVLSLFGSSVPVELRFCGAICPPSFPAYRLTVRSVRSEYTFRLVTTLLPDYLLTFIPIIP